MCYLTPCPCHRHVTYDISQKSSQNEWSRSRLWWFTTQCSPSSSIVSYNRSRCINKDASLDEESGKLWETLVHYKLLVDSSKWFFLLCQSWHTLSSCLLIILIIIGAFTSLIISTLGISRAKNLTKTLPKINLLAPPYDDAKRLLNARLLKNKKRDFFLGPRVQSLPCRL
jgi:hypothetical protein